MKKFAYFGLGFVGFLALYVTASIVSPFFGGAAVFVTGALWVVCSRYGGK